MRFLNTGLQNARIRLAGNEQDRAIGILEIICSLLQDEVLRGTEEFNAEERTVLRENLGVLLANKYVQEQLWHTMRKTMEKLTEQLPK